MPMLNFQDSSQIKFALEQKSKRLQLADALQDYFALNPKTYQRPDDKSERDIFYPEESDFSHSHSSLTDKSLELDSTFHERRTIVETKSGSLDTTFHRERGLMSKGLPLTPSSEPTTFTESRKSGRRVTWKTDFDPSDGTIE